MASKYQTQPYTVVRKLSNVELRFYPAALKIQSAEGFGSLFRFISGENSDNRQIEMTTPVYLGDQQGNNVMEFVLPSDLNKDNVPSPRDERLRVMESKPGYFLAKQFGGYASESKRTHHARSLEEVMAEQGFKAIGVPVSLVYDSPYRLLNRRNEVLWEIEPPAGLQEQLDGE